jgi:trans-aconitate methyltransferase
MSDWDAAAYARHSSLQQAMAEEILDTLQLHGHERVLDVGCGDGRITARIAERLPEGSAVGVDPSADMIAFASRSFADRSNLLFEQGDARRLSHRNAFDRVVSFNALHWVPELEMAVRSLRAVLEPAGGAVLRFVGAGPRKSLEAVLEELRRLPAWRAHFEDFAPPYIHPAPEHFAAIVERCGFRVLHQESVDRSWRFGSREAFAGFAEATMVAWTGKLPKPQRPAFIAEVLDRYVAETADGPGEENCFKFYQLNSELEVC